MSLNGNLKTWNGSQWIQTSGRTAIPDSEENSKLVHRWLLDDVGAGTITDSEGSADGAVNGVASASGDWIGGRAGDGDGTDDYADVGTLGTWGSSLDGTWAVALSISTTGGQGQLLGRSGSELDFRITVDNSFAGTAGRPQVVLRDQNSGGDYLSFEVNNAVDDGSNYRLVINKPTSGAAASNFEWWINQTEQATTANSDAWDGNPSDIVDGLYLWASNVSGSPGNYTDAIIDDICFFDSGLTESEIQSYNNPWS